MSTEIRQLLSFLDDLEIKDRIRELFRERILSFISASPRGFCRCGAQLTGLAPIFLLAYSGEQSTFSTFTDGPDQDEIVAPIKHPGSDDDEDGPRYVVIYSRVSSAEQESEGVSLDAQEDGLVSIVKDEPGLALHIAIKDGGQPGTDFDRPGIKKVGRAIQHDRVEILLIDSIDRLGRTVSETVMFIEELRNHGVTLRTRHTELDIRKPMDRMQIVMRALMADLGTLNSARAAHRSKARNFIDNKNWQSWYRSIPFGYELDSDAEDDENRDEDVWIRVVDELVPVVKRAYEVFIDGHPEYDCRKNYSQVQDCINDEFADLLQKSAVVDGDSLGYHTVRSILTDPVYVGRPTIPVTELERYDPFPFVDDESLQIVDEEMFEEAKVLVDEIAMERSTDDETKVEPEDWADEFSPHVIELLSPPVRIVCDECDSAMVRDGQTRRLDGHLGKRNYKCTNDGCEVDNRTWPMDFEKDMLEMLDKLDELHEFL